MLDKIDSYLLKKHQDFIQIHHDKGVEAEMKEANQN